MFLEVRKVITILEECCLWYILKDFLIGLRGGFEKHCNRASLRSDTVEDLIRISVEGSSLEDVDARESVVSWFSRGQRSRRTNYRSWPFEGHVTAMEDSP